MSASTKRSAIHKSLLRVGTNQIDTKLTQTHLCPINRAPKGQLFYDTIVFVIFCPKHQNIAVCNTYNLNGDIAVWLPFIYQSNKVHYSVAIEDGLCLILSDYDSKQLFKYKEVVPFHTKIIDTIEVYFPKTNKSVIRIDCLAILHNNTPGFQCCRKTSRIYWLSIEKNCCNVPDQFRGTQAHIFCMSLKMKPNHHKFTKIFLNAPELHQGQNYYQNYTVNTAVDYLLKALGITRKQIDLLFIDFYEHCFPETVMSFHSFADYLSKYGFRETNAKKLRLFNSFKGLKSIDPYCTWPYVSFKSFLPGLASIDKESPHNKCRLLFVFQYYNQNRDGFLSEDEFREMVTDIHKNEDQKEINRIVADGMTGNESPKGMNYKEFCNQAIVHEFGDATHLGKSDFQLIRLISRKIESKTTRPMDTLKKLFKINLN